MAEHRLVANLLLRYDTYSNWMNSSVILKQGEAAIAIFPSNDNTIANVGIKVGNGENYFYELPWIQAVAADVYTWAKSSTKPDYYANEILGLSNYIQQYIAEVNPGSGSANSSYRIIYDSNINKYILQTYDENASAWIDTTSIIDFSGVLSRLNSIENWANGAGSNIGNINEPLDATVHDYMLVELNKLNYTDTAQAHQFVTSINETRGKISVNRSTISTSDISGIFPVSQGGTGTNNFEENSLLVGNGQSAITTKPLVTIIESDSTNSIPTAGAVVRYVTGATAGLTGAMHFIGEATVVITNGFGGNPQITGYDFTRASAGDVILYNNAEYVWTGSQWRLLGDEGSYAVKGSITNVDISDEAAISQSKINNLITDLNNKVDKVEGKGLSSNDYTVEEKNKLSTIEENAQLNIIEHITLNGNEVLPAQNKTINLQITPFDEDSSTKLNSIESGAQINTIEHFFLNNAELPIVTVGNIEKSINLQLVEYSQEEKDKLSTIEAEAQVNKIESIKINNVTYTPDKNKNVNIRIDQAALNLDVLEGAQIPPISGTKPEEVEQISKKLQLARIAVTGNVQDLLQTNDTYITLDCGSSIEVI